jgi:ribonuclease HII
MKCTVGIDEVGRGSLAGPVVVVAAMVNGTIRNPKLGKLKDSKKLTKLQREAWFDYLIKNKRVRFALARVYPRQIEKRNVSQAANLAAVRAFGRLMAMNSNLQPIAQQPTIFLDGGLFLGSRDKQPKHAKTIVKGDEKIRAVAIASIIAKVLRDRLMMRLAKRYPHYGFDLHKGYGTKLHQNAIRHYGPTTVHRLTFLTQNVQ